MENNRRNERLRKKAEEELRKGISKPVPVNLDHDQFEHELKVYQIELNMQNEELRNIQIQLQQSHNRFLTLFRQAPLGYIILDSHGVIRETNDTFPEMLGHERSEVLNRNLNHFVLQIDQPIFLARFKAIFKQPENKTLEIRLKKVDSKPIPVQITGVKAKEFQLGDCGETDLLLLSFTDITSLREAEEKEQELLKRFSLISDHIPGMIYQYRLRSDGSSHFPYASKGIANIYGLEAEELKQDAGAVFDVLHPDDLSQVKKSIMVSAKTLRPWHQQYRVCLPSRAPIWVEGNATPQKLEDGSVIWHGYIQDITERKIAENQLRTSERKITKMMESVPAAIFLTCENHHKIDYINSFFTSLFGYSKEDLSSIDEWFRLAYPQDTYRNEVKSKTRALLRHSNADPSYTTKMETNVTCKDGSKKYVLWQGYMIDNQWIGCGFDLTKLKETEQMLIASKEKAEESDQLKSAFLQNISHEVRTPLNAIVGFADLLAVDGVPADKRKSYADIIYERAAQLNAIINDIITIASLETRQEPLTIDAVDINNLLESQLNAFKLQAETKGLELKLTKRLHDDERTVECDQTKLGQIFNNLMVNALKFTNQGSVEFGCSKREDMLEFFVQDTGVGIDLQKQAVIFERFVQAGDDINQTYGGTGLGLSICKGYVDLMGGEIGVDSQPGNGAKFTFTIPYIPNVVPKDNVVTTDKVNQEKQLTILVAEDEYTNYLYLNEILKDFHYNVLHAEDGQQAVEICRENPVDFVLMDIKMPVMDGYAAAKLIREFKPELIMVAQSAFATSSEVARFKMVFHDYVTKPFTRKKLLDIINRFLPEK